MAEGSGGGFPPWPTPGPSAFLSSEPKGVIWGAMKVVLLAGGYGTRIAEESAVRPKPMVEIGGKPVLWHIMKIYSAHGVNDFIICCGYKGDVIKDFFADYFLHACDVTFDLRGNGMTTHTNGVEPWRVTLVDTGEETMTGGRIKRVGDYIGDETFCLTYGDCVGNVDITKLVQFHREEGPLVTLTAVQPPGRFGALALAADQTLIETFLEKPQGDGAWINGGYFVVEPAALEYIEGDSSVWEREPLERLAQDGKLRAYKHRGYWQYLDTLRDKMVLEEAWHSENPPWKLW
jgi:glucose-1-phosphate cytidylyltransferase